MNDSPLRDIVSRIQQQKQQLEEEMKPPKIFSDDLLDDMQQVLLLLEKRVKQGPGALTTTQVQDFSTRTQRILMDMKGSKAAPRIPFEEPRQVMSSSPPVAPPQDAVVPNNVDSKSSDSDLEDGPGYAPDGGSGSLAKGTTNTYIIPGMDSMSAEEYQEALQQSIIARQSKRKISGSYGNRAAHDYLSQLGSKAGMLK